MTLTIHALHRGRPLCGHTGLASAGPVDRFYAAASWHELPQILEATQRPMALCPECDRCRKAGGFK